MLIRDRRRIVRHQKEVRLAYLPLPEAMMCTIRINRAKGTHFDLKMS